MARPEETPPPATPPPANDIPWASLIPLMMGRSSSQQGLPKPLQNLIVSLFQGGLGGQLLPKSMRGLASATNAFDNAPQLINQLAQSQNLQARRDMFKPMQGQMDAMWRNAAGRGAQSSSVASQGVGDIAGQFAQAAQQQASKTGNWANQAKLQNIQNKYQANLQTTGMLGDLMGLARYGSSSSITPTNPFGLSLFGGQ